MQIHTEFPYGSVNYNLILFIIPLDARGHYHLIDDCGNKYRIKGQTYDYLLERGIKVYEIKENSNPSFQKHRQ